ncbi:MAG: T9SS type A sorting domain-containing protein [Bacteroidales bacterium]|nr:T9SS type A sorting domain-containing protein [Bacteroidales bacterium]
MKSCFISTVLVFFYVTCFTQITIDGYILLDGESNNSGIEINLERQAPSSLSYSITTSFSGEFSSEIETGIYNMEILKSGYFSMSLNDIYLYSDSTFADITLYAHSSAIQVPQDFSTIQLAIDNSQNGDTVIISEGIYYENINFNGHSIFLTSMYVYNNNPTSIYNTIINGNGLNSVVTFNSDESSSTVLNGITIENGNASNGGGIHILNASPILSNLQIQNNSSENYGGGVYIYGSSDVIFTNSVVRNNNSNERGGGIFVGDHSKVTIQELEILNNSSNYKGGGIHIDGYETSSLRNVLISGNYAESRGGGLSTNVANSNLENVIIKNNYTDFGGSGILVQYGTMNAYNIIVSNNRVNTNGAILILDGTLNMYNSIITENTGTSVINIVETGTYTPHLSLEYSNIWNNQTNIFDNCGAYIGTIVTSNANGTPCDAFNNIFEYPNFTDTLNNDYSLLLESPCIDAGLNTYSFCNIDFIGNIRIWDGNNDSESVIDMGALEFNSEPFAEDSTESSKEKDIYIFPNPSADFISIYGVDIKYIEIFNTLGKRVYIGLDEVINISNYDSGMYIIRLTTSLETISRKFIKH